MGVLSICGNDRIHTDHALMAADGIESAMDLVKCFSERVRDLVKRDQLDCILVSNPFQWHAGHVCA